MVLVLCVCCCRLQVKPAEWIEMMLYLITPGGGRTATKEVSANEWDDCVLGGGGAAPAGRLKLLTK